MERTAVIIPVYNEGATLEKVLARVQAHPGLDVVLVDDGSEDATPSILERVRVKAVLRHPRNEGYGKSLRDGFRFALENGYLSCVTMDADEQHEPDLIPAFVAALKGADVVSGSRYLDPALSKGVPPPERLEVNRLITGKLRPLTGYDLTDSFCGFKSYRVEALERLALTEVGYGFPIQFWIQAAKAGLKVVEMPVPLIYKDHSRNFNDQFAGRDERLAHYLGIMEREAAGLSPSIPSAKQ